MAGARRGGQGDSKMLPGGGGEGLPTAGVDGAGIARCFPVAGEKGSQRRGSMKQQDTFCCWEGGGWEEGDSVAPATQQVTGG